MHLTSFFSAKWIIRSAIIFLAASIEILNFFTTKYYYVSIVAIFFAGTSLAIIKAAISRTRFYNKDLITSKKNYEDYIICMLLGRFLGLSIGGIFYYFNAFYVSMAFSFISLLIAFFMYPDMEVYY